MTPWEGGHPLHRLRPLALLTGGRPTGENGAVRRRRTISRPVQAIGTRWREQARPFFLQAGTASAEQPMPALSPEVHAYGRLYEPDLSPVPESGTGRLRLVIEGTDVGAHSGVCGVNPGPVGTPCQPWRRVRHTFVLDAGRGVDRRRFWGIRPIGQRRPLAEQAALHRGVAIRASSLAPFARQSARPRPQCRYAPEWL